MLKYILLFFVLFVPCAHAVDYNKYVADMVDEVNALREKRGLKPWVRDDVMQAKCEEITYERCYRRHKSHLPGKPFYPTATNEGVGWFGGIDFTGKHFTTCYLYSRGFTRCGAALCVHSNGTTYYTLILR